MSSSRLQALADIGNNAALARPEGLFQQGAARGLVDLAEEAIQYLRSPEGLDDITAYQLRQKARKLRKDVHDPYLLQLFDVFDAVLKKQD